MEVARAFGTKEEQDALAARIEKALAEEPKASPMALTPTPPKKEIKSLGHVLKPEQKVAVIDDPDRLQSIDSALQQFLEDPEQLVLVVFGDAGLGKSSSVYRLAEQLLAKSEASVLPMLLRSGLPTWSHSTLTGGLDRAVSSPVYGLTPPQQVALKRQPTLWMIDGYDELQRDQAPQNLPTQLGLAEWPQAKIMISCRRQIVGQHEQAARFGYGERRQLTYYQLLPFRQDQLLIYMQRRLGWSETKRKSFSEALSESDALRALLRTPFVLQLLVESWEGIKDQPLDKLSRFTVYQHSIAYHLQKNAALIPETIRRVLQGSEASLVESFYRMAEKLAVYGYQQQQAIVPIAVARAKLDEREVAWLELPRLVSHYAERDYIHRQKQLKPEQKHRAILSQTDYVRLRRQQAEKYLQKLPFKPHHQLGVHDYRHRSLYEYLVAHAQISALQQEDTPRLTEQLRVRLIQEEPEVLAFFYEAWKTRSFAIQAEWSKLLKQVVVNYRRVEPILYPAEVVLAVSASQALSAAVMPAQAAWQMPPSGYASSNAATLLNYCGEMLISLDWHGVYLARAELSYAVLTETNLSGSNLEGTCLRQAILRGVNFRRANLQKVDFGTLPSLAFEEIIAVISHHPTQPWLAVSQANTIVIRHCDSGELISKPLVGQQPTSWVAIDDKPVPFLGQRPTLIWSIVFSPDGRWLAAGSSDGGVYLWDMSTQTPLSVPLAGHEDAITSLSFSPDGRLLASGSLDCTVQLWNVDSHKPFGTLVGHTGGVMSVSFAPNGRLLASGSEDGTVRLWDTVIFEQCSSQPLFEHRGAEVSSVVFSPDGQILASGSANKTPQQLGLNDVIVTLWNVESLTLLGQLLVSEWGKPLRIAFSPDSQLLAASINRGVWLWDMRSQMPFGKPLPKQKGTVMSVIFAPNGRQLLSGGHDQRIHRWAVTSQGLSEKPLSGHTSGILSVTFSPDGRWIASGSYDQTVRLWDAVSQTHLGLLAGHTNVVTSVAFSPDGCLLASGSSDGTVRLWNTLTCEPFGTPLVGHTHPVFSVAFSPSAGLLASGSYDHTIRLWNVERQCPFGKPLSGHKKRIYGIAFSPDGQWLSSGSEDGIVRLWNVEKQCLSRTLLGHTGWVSSVAFSPDGRWLASGSYDGTIRLWNRLHNLEPITMYAHGRGMMGGVSGISFSGDSKWLISGAQDKTLRLWNLGNFKCCAVHVWGTEINCVSFRPALHLGGFWQVALGDGDSGVSIWQIDAAFNKFRLMVMYPHVGMPLLVDESDFADCQMTTMTRRILEQHGGKLERAHIIEVEEAKAGLTSAPSFSNIRAAAPSLGLAEIKAHRVLIAETEGLLQTVDKRKLRFKSTCDESRKLIDEYRQKCTRGEPLNASELARLHTLNRLLTRAQPAAAISPQEPEEQKHSGSLLPSPPRPSAGLTIASPFTVAGMGVGVSSSSTSSSSSSAASSSPVYLPALLPAASRQSVLASEAKATPLSAALAIPGIGLFAASAAPAQLSAEQQRDLAWLEELQKRVDDCFDFRDAEQFRLVMKYSDQIEQAQHHCKGAPLTEAQRKSLQEIIQACDAAQQAKAAAVVAVAS